MPHFREMMLAPARVVALAAAVALLTPAAARAQIAQAEYAARRAALARALPGDGVLVVRGALAPAVDYETFDQLPDFRYLTGIDEPDAALVIHRRGGRTDQLLFVRPRDPAREIWEGRSLGVEGASARTGVETRPRQALPTALDSLLAGGGTLYFVGQPPFADARTPGEWSAPTGVRTVPAIRQLAQLRAAKSPAELDLLRKAIAITVEAHENAMRLVEPGLNEFEVEALVEYVFRRYGAARPGFASIVGSGPNATSLHYNRNDRFMQPGELVVLDIGASYRGYSADVTRTLPVSGRFTPDQRAVYQIVRDAQRAAEAEARPGGSAAAMSRAAARTIAEGLARLGLIESPDATYECGDGRRCAQYTLFYLHGLGHGIGLEVHDPERYQFGPIAEGSVFTIEPGIYVREDALANLPDTPANRALRARLAPVVQRYANIGVRIEDDYIVGPDGAEWISRVPREADEVEAAMAKPWTGPSARDAGKVGWWKQGESERH